jgi:hypothetical protein
MNFEIVETKLNDIIAAGAVAGGYNAVGYPQSEKSAEEINALPQVVAFYQAGDFSGGSGGINSNNKQHNATYSIMLYVAQKSADTDGGFLVAGKRVNTKINSLIAFVYQLLMKGENLWLQTEDATGRLPFISSRQIPNIAKTPLEEKSSFAVISATMNLTAQMAEAVVSATGEIIENVVNNLSLEGDDTAVQGTETDLT